MKNRLKKVIACAFAAMMVMGVSSTALATSTNYTNKRIYGGASQTIMTGSRSRSNNVSQYVSSVNRNGQSGWKLRAYNHSTGGTCTDLVSITVVGGYNYANYTSKPTTVRVKNSIASSSSSSYLSFTGSVSV